MEAGAMAGMVSKLEKATLMGLPQWIWNRVGGRKMFDNIRVEGVQREIGLSSALSSRSQRQQTSYETNLPLLEG
jgi:hypothetical protein